MSDKFGRFVTLVLTFTFITAPLTTNGFGGFYKESFPVQVDRWPAQPVGWAFSVWGVIYLALLALALWAVATPRRTPNWHRLAWPLALSLLIGSFWIEAATYAPVLATIMILPMTLCAVMAMQRADNDWRQTIPLGLYAGWLTAASGVAISVVLTGYGILTAQSAAIILIVAVLAVSLWLANRVPKAWAYRAGVIWALFGIIVANAQVENWTMTVLATAGIAAHIFLGRTAWVTNK